MATLGGIIGLSKRLLLVFSADGGVDKVGVGGHGYV